MLSSAGGLSLALHTIREESSGDRPACLENPRPAGAEYSLTENVTSPFQAEPRQVSLVLIMAVLLMSICTVGSIVAALRAVSHKITLVRT